MTAVTAGQQSAPYHGLRMTADAYFRLKDDGCRYELIDGAVCVSPSPDRTHQKIALEIAFLIRSFLEQHPVGEVLHEIDVHIGQGATGQDLVYRPDVVFLGTQRAAQCGEHLFGPPDVVVEVISSDSRAHDTVKKKADYERCGVPECWLIDPHNDTMTFWRLEGGHYLEIPPVGGEFASTAIPGFSLDLTRMRSFFKPAR